MTRTSLKSLGIRHFDQKIHDQDGKWLIKYFKKGADEYPVNVALLMRNLVWQMRERIQRGEKPFFEELIRSYWYFYVKPTLAKAGALSQKVDQYPQFIEVLVSLVKDDRLMKYKDIGFQDDNAALKRIGYNTNVILFSEKANHFKFLEGMWKKHQISVIALGGQPSVLSCEYFVDDIKRTGIDIRKTFHLFSMVDYDPSGWIIRDSFIDNLKLYGIKNIKFTELIHPDMLTEEETIASKYPVRDPKNMFKKNSAWLQEIKKRKYNNQKHLGPFRKRKGQRIIYGLESEAVSTTRISAKLDKLLSPILKDTLLLRITALERFSQALKELLIMRL